MSSINFDSVKNIRPKRENSIIVEKKYLEFVKSSICYCKFNFSTTV